MTTRRGASKAPDGDAQDGFVDVPRSVVALTIDSYQRISAASIGRGTPHSIPSVGAIEIRGRNEQGKSSVLDALLDAFGLRKSEMPINDGADFAGVAVDLGDLRVTKRWTRDASGAAKAAVVVESNGIRLGSPAAVLERLRGKFADPIAFLSLSPADQAKTVLAVLGLDGELERMEQIARGHYDRRRDLGRDADRAEKAASVLEQEVGGLGNAFGGALGVDEVDGCQQTLSELTEELGRRKDANATAKQLLSALQTKADQGRQVSASIKDKDRDLDRARETVKALEDQLAQMHSRRESLLAEWHLIKNRIDSGEANEVEIESIVNAIDMHGERQERRAKVGMAQQARAAADTAKELHAACERDLEAARSAISTLLSTAPFPVDGMAYDVDGQVLTINGIPFSQASQAQRLRAAAAIAMAGAPSIRVLFAREGSLLDSHSREMLERQAEDAGFQLWIEIVADAPNGPGIWIEDGQVV